MTSPNAGLDTVSTTTPSDAAFSDAAFSGTPSSDTTSPLRMESYASSDVRILQGQYVGSHSSSKGRLKWLQINYDGDEVLIKLPKLIGYTLVGKLQPGMMLQVWCRPKDDYLKALKVIPVAIEGIIHDDSSDRAEHDALKNPLLSDTASHHSPKAYTLKVCTKGKCGKQGSYRIVQALEAAVRSQGLGNAITIETSSCLKNCKKGPTIKVSPGSTKYSSVKVQDVPQILQRHIIHIQSDSV